MQAKHAFLHACNLDEMTVILAAYFHVLPSCLSAQLHQLAIAACQAEQHSLLSCLQQQEFSAYTQQACHSCTAGHAQQFECGLAALASRIKYMVDTSEMIWGSLDAGDVLAASMRFLRASTVHKLLLSAAGPAVTTRFPLVVHQWPAIEKFR